MVTAVTGLRGVIALYMKFAWSTGYLVICLTESPQTIIGSLYQSEADQHEPLITVSSTVCI